MRRLCVACASLLSFFLYSQCHDLRYGNDGTPTTIIMNADCECRRRRAGASGGRPAGAIRRRGARSGTKGGTSMTIDSMSPFDGLCNDDIVTVVERTNATLADRSLV